MTNYKGYTRKQVAELINAYLLNCILSTEQWADEYCIQAITDKDRVNAVVDEFNSWYTGYTQKRHPNRQQGFAEWLRGEPGVISIEQWYDDQIKLAIEWGSIPDNYTDKQYTKITENWYNYISCKFWQLHTKLNK